MLAAFIHVERTTVRGPLIRLGLFAHRSVAGANAFNLLLGAAGLCLGPVVSIATVGVASHESGTASGLLNSSRQIGASLGLAALGTAARHRTGPAATPEALNEGYALGLGLSAALLVAAVLIASTGLRRTGTPATAPAGATT